MYKIYINDTPLMLMSREEKENRPAAGASGLVARYPGKSKFLLHYIDMLEKSDRYQSVVLYSPDLDALWRDFKSLFTLIEAAGGLVFNDSGSLLFIYRRGSWDLPKGKIDSEESSEDAAVREVQEETGLHSVKLDGLFDTTYHTYRQKGGRILKRTYWYTMHTSRTELVPEEEEDIEIATWMTIDEFFGEEREVYGNIRDLLVQYEASQQ